MCMTFTIVAAVIEQLNEYFDENTKEREEAVERAVREAEEAERVGSLNRYCLLSIVYYHYQFNTLYWNSPAEVAHVDTMSLCRLVELVKKI